MLLKKYYTTFMLLVRLTMEPFIVLNRGGVEVTRPRTQKNPRPRTQAQVFFKKKSTKIFSGDLKNKQGLRNNFSGNKGLKFFYAGDLKLRKAKKVFANFSRGFWHFPTEFQRLNNSALLEPSTGQFSGT